MQTTCDFLADQRAGREILILLRDHRSLLPPDLAERAKVLLDRPVDSLTEKEQLILAELYDWFTELARWGERYFERWARALGP